MKIYNAQKGKLEETVPLTVGDIVEFVKSSEPRLSGIEAINQPVKPRTVDLSLDYAAQFTRMKGHMPWDVHQLREWLRQFAEVETRRADLMMDALKEHLNVCSQTVYFKHWISGTEKSRKNL